MVTLHQREEAGSFCGKVLPHLTSFHGAIQDHIPLLLLYAVHRTVLHLVFSVNLDGLEKLLALSTQVRAQCARQGNTHPQRALLAVMTVKQAHFQSLLGPAPFYHVRNVKQANTLVHRL